MEFSKELPNVRAKGRANPLHALGLVLHAYVFCTYFLFIVNVEVLEK